MTGTSLAELKASQQTNSPFAAKLSKLKDNPFDIIHGSVPGSAADSATMSDGEYNQESVEQVVVVGVSGDIGDSDDSSNEDGAIRGQQNASFEDGESSSSDYEYDLEGNDPSLYKITPTDYTSIDNTQDFETSPQLMQVDSDQEDLPVEPAGDEARESVVRRVFPNECNKRSGVYTANDTSAMAGNAFDKPLESLSLRSHVSITSDTPLKQLDRLKDDGSFLALTSLCGGKKPEPLNRMADALLHYEIVGSGDGSKRPALQSRDSQGSSATSRALPGTETSGGASAGQVQQAFMSLFRLQLEAPAQYEYIYLVVRDYSVVFRMARSSSEPSGYRRMAAVSQSSFGLRKTLRAEGVDFSLPLAPKLQSWSEIPGAIQHDDGAAKWHLQSTAFDKTWRSALLVVDAVNVNGLFSHLYSTPLGGARIYSTGPFLNSTMRRSTLRFSSATTYEDKAETKERATKQLFKLDVKGVIFPSYWTSILTALAEAVGNEGFYASFKETPDTAHLTLLTPKQSSALASKKTVTYKSTKYVYT
ncbi:hypothetical protein GGI12_004361 [Dipsacomyces acuminosporus]|nr:hypothetical protein GGI12_004361 [Dipsacomyces acuminosporus]